MTYINLSFMVIPQRFNHRTVSGMDFFISPSIPRYFNHTG
nr:MAG TPA: hypothetical protein [Bacteriophage sp.]